MKVCPYCWERVKDIARKCRYCWERLDKWNADFFINDENHKNRLKRYGERLIEESKKAEIDADNLVNLYWRDPDFANAVAQEFWYDDYADAKISIDNKKRKDIEENEQDENDRFNRDQLFRFYWWIN